MSPPEADTRVLVLMGLRNLKPVLEAQVMSEVKAQSGSKAERTRST